MLQLPLNPKEKYHSLVDHKISDIQYGESCWEKIDAAYSRERDQTYNLSERSTNGFEVDSPIVDSRSSGCIKMELETMELSPNNDDGRSSDASRDDGDTHSLDETALAERNGKHGKVDPKVCGVCGDKALGNNFNAITCESCKAFFRRNALRTKEFVCPFNDNCKVDPVTRRFCQKCRLKKCFDIGMKKEWIMTDEEKKMKKQKIEQNRMKRASSESQPQLMSGEVTAPKIPAVGDQVPEKQQLNSAIETSPQLTKQPMMPHNNNSIQDPLEISQNDLLVIKNRSSTSPSPIEHSRIPTVIHSVPSSHEGVLRRLDDNSHPLNFAGISPESPRVAWCENSENSNSVSQSKLIQPYLQQQKEPFSPTHEISKATPVVLVQNGQPPQMPLLASLIGTGVAESPPVPQFAESSTSSFPDSYDEEEGGELLGSDREDYQKADSPNSSPPHILSLTGGVLMGSAPYKHESVQSTNQSSSKDSIPEELAPLPLNTMDSILSVAISAEFNAFGVLGHTQSHHSKDLNKAEKAKLNELFFAGQALNAPVDADGPIKIESCDPSLINVINLTDIAIRRLIKMSKKICAFKNMCQEDQIALLKGGCTEMMILRSVVSYDPERDSWNIPHSNGYNIKLGVLKEARGNLYEEHQRFVKSFKAEWRTDDNIMTILCAITLFTPERPNVIHKDVVKLEQDSYYYLLKRYLESTRNGCEARSTYLQLIQKIAELHVLNSNHLRVFLEVNPREVEPLLIEIFDLKQ